MQRGPGLACGHAWLLIGGTMAPRAAGDSRVMVLLLLLLLHPVGSTPFGAVAAKVSPDPNPSASYSRPSPGAEEPPGRQTRLLAATSKSSEASGGKALLPPQAAETHVGRPRGPIPPEPGRAERIAPAERGAHQSASGAREGGPAHSLTAQSSTEPRLSPQVGALSALGSTRTDTPSEALRRTEPRDNVEVGKEVLKASEPAGRYALEPKGTRALAHARSEEQRAEAGIPLAAARTVAVIPSENEIKEAGIRAEPGRTRGGIPSEPGRTKVGSPSKPGRTEVGIPSEPDRTVAGIPSEPGRTEVGSPSESGRTEVGIHSEPGRTVAGIPSEPGRTEVGSPSESGRTEVGIPLEPGRTEVSSPSKPGRTEAGIPSESGRTEVGIPSEPGRTEGGIPSEPGRTEVGSPSESGRTEVGIPSESGRTEVGIHSEPGRTVAGIPSEPGRTEVGSPSESGRTEVGIPLEPGRTEVGIPLEPGRTEVGIPLEPGRTEVGIPSLPGRTERSIPSEPVRTEVGIQSAPGRTEVGILSEPGSTEVGIPSEPGRTEVGIPLLLGRTEWSIPSEPVRTEVGIQSAPGRTEVGIPLEPGRTEVGIPSEPGRTEVGIPLEPGRTERSIPSEPVRTEVGIRSAPDRTEGGIPSGSGRTVHTLWQSETHSILSDALKAHAQLPPVQGSTEPLPPSEPWRTEVRMLSDIAESSSPPDQFKPEARMLPQVGREGLAWHGIVGQGRASQRNTIGVHTSQALVPSGVQTHSELVTTDTPTSAKPNKKGADTPPEPGGTGALPEWDQAQTQHGPERTVMAIKTPRRTGSSQYWRPPEQGMVRGQTISTTGASRVSNLNETGTTNNKTSPELYVTTPDAISGLMGHTTRAPPAPYGLTANTTSRRGETVRQYSSEPSGTESQTSNGSKFVETTTKAQSESIWPRLNIVSGTETDVRGNNTLQEDGWTGTYGAAEQDWAGFGEKTEVQSVSASETMLVSEQGKGNSNQPVSSSDTEKKTSHTDSMYISTTFNRGGERTLLSITNGSASVDITESSTYYNVSKTSDPPDSSWAENTGRTKKLKGDTDFTIDSWENFLKRSSKTSTHSSQTSYPGVESQEPMDNSYDTPIGGSNTADPSEGSHATISKSENDSNADSFSSSLSTSLSSASSSQLSETFPSTSSQSFSSSDSGISTSFVLPAPSTVSVLSSPSVTEGPPYSASASTPHLTLAPVPGIHLSSPVPTNFSDDPPSLSTSPSPSSHSLPSQSPSSLYSSSMSIPWSPSLPPSTTPSSASLPAESFQPTPTPLARKRTEESSTPLYDSTVTSNSALGTEDKEAMESTTLLTSPSALSTERFNGSSKMDVGHGTESFTEGTITAKGDFFAKTTVLLGTERVSTQETLQTEVPKQATSSVPNAPMLTDRYTTLQPTTRKTVPAISRTSETQSLEPTTESSVLFGTPSTQPVHTTSASATPGESTAHLGLNTTTNKSTAQTLTPAVSHKPIHPVKTTYMIPTVTKKTSTMPASKSTPTPLPTSHATVGICSPNPCLHGGRCVLDNTTSTYKCACTPSWTGEQCATDVDECLSNPCPSKATCINAPGSFTCRCPLGYQLEKGAGCSLVRTFLGQIKISSRFKNSSDWNPLEQGDIEGEIAQMFSMSLAMIEGYNTSTILDTRETSDIILSVQHIFSFESNVTIYDIMRSLQNYMKSCDTSDTRPEHCRLLAQYQLYYKADSLCHQKYPECDKETSECTDLDGIAICQCRTGYFKYSKMDYSCRACEDGFKRENGTCVRCPFGLGGFNCGNPYQLITIVIAAAGGGLLLILGTALIITCCRKNKNDISKLIFKSGDFQMSPYAEYPKNPRSSEWGREAIEMQENGSTKNLLQVADVYYSQPGLRNPELERNGLFPYTGVPGSRHSCIYPGQYNPSFLNEESRRRDYF